MCCAIAALLFAALAAWRGLVRGALALRMSRRWMAAMAAGALVTLGDSAMADMQMAHGGERADGGVLQMLAQHICGRPASPRALPSGRGAN
jgi:hypothetical protein